MALLGIALSFAAATTASHAAQGPGADALASIPVVELPQGPVYWHLDTYRTRAEAHALSGPRSTVVEAFANVWLFTLAEVGWRPAGGVRVATIGPLEVRPEGRYTASYMQAATSPGFRTDVHQHGSEMRRSLVLILHDAAQPWKVPSTSSWTPKGLCVRPNG